MKKAALKKLISLLAIFSIVFSAFPIGYVYAGGDYSEITTAAVYDVDAPIHGTNPDFSISVENDAPYMVEDFNELGFVNGISWNEYDSDQNYVCSMDASSEFKLGYYYELLITLQANDDSIFSDSVTGYINDKYSEVVYQSEDGKHITIASPRKKLTMTYSLDLTAEEPVAGNKPSFALISGDTYCSDNNGEPPTVYKNGVAWFKNAYSYISYGTNEVFEEGHDYIFKIILMTREDFVFSENISITVNGKEASVTFINEECVLVEVVLTEGGGTILGDVNGDGEINTKDLSRLMKKIAGEEVEIFSPDINEDGAVNTKDLTRLMKIIAGV